MNTKPNWLGLLEGLQLANPRFWTAGHVADLAPHFLAVAVQDQNRRETLGLVFRLECFICLFQRVGLLLAVREIDLHPFLFKERFWKKGASAQAGFAVGHYEVCEFFTWVEFENQPG